MFKEFNFFLKEESYSFMLDLFESKKEVDNNDFFGRGYISDGRGFGFD